GTYYYYVRGVQADGHDFWSAPMWITYNLTGCTAPASPVAGNNGPLCPGATLNLTASTVAGATYSWTGPLGFSSTDQNPSITNVQPNQAGTYSVVAIDAGCPSIPATTAVVVRNPSVTISAPPSLCPTSVGVASVPDAGTGATYAWTVTNGTIQSGQGTRFLTFGSGASGTVDVGVTIQYPESCSAVGSAQVQVDTGCVVSTSYFTLTPCRVFDTRDPDGPLGGPFLSPGQVRSFTLPGTCSIPPSAISVSGNITVTQPTAPGFLRLFPGDSLPPGSSTINFSPGQTRANNLILGLASDGSGTINVENGSTGTAHTLFDVNGYFGPGGTGPSVNQLLIRINEVDADQASTDTAEFLELVAPAGTSLTNILAVFHNGSSAFTVAGYRAHDLTGQSFPATPLTGGTKSILVLGPAGLVNYTPQPYNALYSTGWPASNAIQNANVNEADGILVAYDQNANGTYDDGVDLIIDKYAYVQSGGTDGGSATNAGFKAIYGSTGSTYATIDTTSTSMGKNTDNLPAATGATWNYTTDNVNSLAQTPGAINPGQTNGL
ncbi:MAG: hypothetical protein EDX89_22975, partial [Acidobacteria bacterium]